MVYLEVRVLQMNQLPWTNDWKKAIQQLQNELPSQTFDAWVHPLSAKLEDGKLYLCGPSDFFISGLKAACKNELESVMYENFGECIDIQYQVDKSLSISLVQSIEATEDAIPSNIDGHIDPRFTFQNFIVGSSNEFAFAACQAVAEEPGESYNPLYLHGGVGLGKTHLIHAIANQLAQKKDVKVAYRTGEQFTNELIHAIRNRSNEQFRNQYRKVDVLIIDDIQFIENKTSTQEEFFHTFNALHAIRKQIILVSDRNPHEMSLLEERLKSRFNWGLVADIQPPDLETRLAILGSKSELAGITLDQDVSYLLASRIANNVRELEGALTRLTAFSHLTNKKIDMDMAKNVLREQLKVILRTVNVDDIQKKIAEYYGIATKDMRSPKRTKAIAFPRQIAMYASKELTKLSLPEIGVQFGGRDHTTVLYAHRKIEAQRQDDPELDQQIEQLLTTLRG